MPMAAGRRADTPRAPIPLWRAGRAPARRLLRRQRRREQPALAVRHPELLQQATQLMRQSTALVARLDAIGAKADRQVFGSGKDDGLLPEVRASVAQVSALLQDARQTLSKVDGVLAEAQAVGANARAATTDLAALRADVDANLRKVEGLINEINRKWPFARDTELKLP